MSPVVSAGSNQVGAIEIVAAQVSWPFGSPARAGPTMLNTNTAATRLSASRCAFLTLLRFTMDSFGTAFFIHDAPGSADGQLDCSVRPEFPSAWRPVRAGFESEDGRGPWLRNRC